MNPKWTSYGALEIDVFSETRGDFETFVAALEPLGKVEFDRDLQEWHPHTSKGEAVAETISLLKAERFWEAHEVLEALWRAAEGEERSLLQGLIFVCAAFVHLQKGEPRVALGLARRSIPRLAWREPTYHGLAVTTIKNRIEAMVDSGKLDLFEV